MVPPRKLTSKVKNGMSKVTALILVGLVSMTAHWLYAVTFDIPFFTLLVNFRGGTIYLQFLVPVLAGLGLVAVPQVVANAALRWLRAPQAPYRPLAAGLAVC